jgi:phosphoribosylamine--glycine ligase
VNVLITGSGAREHTIAWKLRQSPRLTDLFCAPGNPGLAAVGTNLKIADSDHDAIVSACREHHIDLVVVGSEEPLAAGLVDRLTVEGIAAFGPSRAAAQIEWSKVFAKELMARHGIPTAPFGVFDEAEAARIDIRERGAAVAIKADGLAKGKGVIVPASEEEALQALAAIMEERTFGESGARVVIEQRLNGPEVSAMAFTDGKTVAHMPFSCDHKPIFDGNRGPNTGGMGAYSPAGWLSAADAEFIRTSITEAAVRALADEGHPYRGVLYPGIMVTDSGPMVIEFNSRLGDPEAQVLLPRLQTDLLDIFLAVVNNRLDEVNIEWSDDACVGVVLASGGYPGSCKTGLPISGLDQLDDGILVFHAGTALDANGRLVTGGGRVLTVVASGATMDEARERVYRNVERIPFEGVHYRRDIGLAATASATQ